MELAAIGVVGAGTMGHGIAQVLAQNGLQVMLNDVSSTALQLAREKIESQLRRQEMKDGSSAPQASVILARIHPCPGLRDLARCTIVIEAASEDPQIKQALFSQLDRDCAPDTILASNTSSIPLTRIAAWSRHPHRVIGMHFMNPAPLMPLMPLIEIVRARQTDDATWRAIADLCQHIGKSAITVSDAPGFVSNRILMPMINEAIFTLHEGVASAADIDRLMQLGMRHPQGPLALADRIGLDTCLAIMDVLYQSFRDSKYRACPLLAQMVAAGCLGRKTGQGFYQYQTA